MAFNVTKVIDGDTFTVNPKWEWNNQTGEYVRPLGYNAPEKGTKGYTVATNKLKKLIEGKNVELKNAVKLTYSRLLCDVFINGKNIKTFFPEYQ